MYKFVLFLAPCLLSIALVHSYIYSPGGVGGLGASGYGGGPYAGYPFNTYRNTVAALNGNYLGNGMQGYSNPNRWAFLLPLALSLLLAFNRTSVATTG